MNTISPKLKKWKLPPKIKVYEALGALGDGRIDLLENGAFVRSSGKRKTYTVEHDPDQNIIMANDNGSYWQGYLGYPSIVYLMKRRILKFKRAHALALAGIDWKDLNTDFNNDYQKTIEYAHQWAKTRGVTVQDLEKSIKNILQQLEKLSLGYQGSRNRPPQ